MASDIRLYCIPASALAPIILALFHAEPITWNAGAMVARRVPNDLDDGILTFGAQRAAEDIDAIYALAIEVLGSFGQDWLNHARE